MIYVLVTVCGSYWIYSLFLSIWPIAVNTLKALFVLTFSAAQRITKAALVINTVVWHPSFILPNYSQFTLNSAFAVSSPCLGIYRIPATVGL